VFLIAQGVTTIIFSAYAFWGLKIRPAKSE
jgi:hypothetical protein